MELDSPTSLNVLLVANYEPDGQVSMKAFAQMMAEELIKRGHNARIIRPQPCLGTMAPGQFLKKWLAYLDKYVLFLPELLKQKKWADVVHICDHSNGVYVPYIVDKPHVVTCHDLLAVRQALGEDTSCPMSPMGFILQRWILSGLRKAKIIGCDSTQTKEDAERLIGYVGGRKITLIPLSLNYPYRVVPEEEVLKKLAAVPQLDASKRFLLHVGSSQPRKNREGVIRLFAEVKDQFAGQCVFAGAKLFDHQWALARQLGVDSRIVEVPKADGEILVALYNRAFAFIFPSYSEGFGWPILEAQASGCPVIVSSVEPSPETAGAGAIVHEPDDLAGMAQSLVLLNDGEFRKNQIESGFANLRRFDKETMTKAYLELYLEAKN